MRGRQALWIAAAGVVAAIVVLAATCRGDVAALRSRLAAGSELVPTSFGPLEVAQRGEGPPVVVLHGAGGGYDQGLMIARTFGGQGFRWLSVSRFGYLRSVLPPDASTAAQADALAEALVALGTGPVAVLAMSGGVPPALQLAERHPGQVRALVLLSSAPYTPHTAAEQDLPLPAPVYRALFGADFPYWALLHLAPGQLSRIFDVPPERAADLSAEDRAFVSDLVAAFLPVTDRMAGLANEGAAIDASATYRLSEIRAPALVVHARDDGINPFAIGAATARDLPDAVFLPLDTGGHLLLGHAAEVRRQVAAFLAAHSG